MENEIHYLTYDPEAIYEEMVEAYVNAGGDYLYPGDEKEMLLRAVQQIIVQMFAGVDNALRMSTRRYAVGEYLDIVGENDGVERIQDTPARVMIEISLQPNGERHTIPKGTQMSADGSAMFETTEDIVVDGISPYSINTVIVAEKSGSAGNNLVSFTNMYLSSADPTVKEIYTITSSYGGKDREDDDSYRKRIPDFSPCATTGTAAQYEYAAKNANAHIIDVRAIREEPGVVGVYILCDDKSAEGAALADVIGVLENSHTRPLTDNIAVSTAVSRKYILNIYYMGDANVEKNAHSIAAEYKEWQENTIGRPFNPERLVAELYRAGASRVKVAEGSNIDGEPAVYTEIAQTERCIGTVNVTYGV